MNIIKPSSPMRAKPNELSRLETECLFGETVEVFDNNLEWVYCKLFTDNYYGWIKKKDLGDTAPVTHKIISKRSFLYENKNAKSNCIHHLPLGAQISVLKIENSWAKICLANHLKQKFVYIPSNHLVEINYKVQDWVGIAEQLIGTPYKWGGRDSIGLDCSALLQLSYQAYGQNIPRNTIDQLTTQKEIITDLNSLDRGFVIFWKGHVGIMVDKLNCIHANAFHMKTIIEPLKDIIVRMGKENEIIKIMNFN